MKTLKTVALVAVIFSASGSFYSYSSIRAIQQEQRDLAQQLRELNIVTQRASAGSNTDSARGGSVPAIAAEDLPTVNANVVSGPRRNELPAAEEQDL